MLKMDTSKLYRTMEPTLSFQRSLIAIGLVLGGLIDWKGLNAQEPSLPISSHVENYLDNFSKLTRFGCFYEGTVVVIGEDDSKVLEVKGFYAQDNDQDCIRVDDQVTDATTNLRYSREPSSFLRIKDKSFLCRSGKVARGTVEDMRPLMRKSARFNPIDLPILTPDMVFGGYRLDELDQSSVLDPKRLHQESQRSELDVGIYHTQHKTLCHYFGFDPETSMLVCVKTISNRGSPDLSPFEWKAESDNKVKWHEYDSKRFVPVEIKMEKDFGGERLAIEFKLAWLIDKSLPDSVFDPARLIRRGELEQLRSMCIMLPEEEPSVLVGPKEDGE